MKLLITTLSAYIEIEFLEKLYVMLDGMHDGEWLHLKSL